ncbi:MAG: thiolase domain-containing protein, partial [Phycisphaerae bacterium]|nr:thiolase domain-containing protein [Phycisphaerae bacterium]
MRQTEIIGVGMTSFGQQADRSLRDLAGEAALAALDDAGCGRLDAIWGGGAATGLLAGQSHLAPLIAGHIGQTPVIAGSVESAGASGALALRAAWLEVASGQVECALALGTEKVSDADGDLLADAEAAMLDREHEADAGGSLAALFAMIAREH